MNDAVSYAISTGLSVLFIIILVYSFIVINGQYENFIINNEVNELCSLIKTGVNKIYSKNMHSSELIINTPDKIAGKNYRMVFGDNLTIKLSGSNITGSCFFGINANFSGSVSGGDIKITYNNSHFFAEVW